MDGNLLIHLSCIFFCIAFLSIISSIIINHPKLKLLGIGCTFIGCGGIIISFLSLVHAYIVSDISLINVAMNSNKIMPLHYRIAAVWGNHEGSILLLSMYFSIASVVSYKMTSKERFALNALLVQLSFNIILIIFIIKTSNPFIRVFPMPQNGMGLNPVLQDSGLIIHPPILYLGHAGCFIIYSLITSWCRYKDFNRNWLLYIKPWIFFSSAFLTLGIGLGSWWAYKEIGWGGFWFWDPVENISVFPWLMLYGLLHSCSTMEKRGNMRNMTFFLGICSFISVLLGIFIVRAGILKSIHSFAEDPDRGNVLFCIFLGYSGYGFWQFSNSITSTPNYKSITNKLIFSSNWIFISCFLVIFLGTFYPLYYEFIHNRSISIGASYFNFSFNTLMVLGLILYIIMISIRNRKKLSYIPLGISVLIIISLFSYLPPFARDTIDYTDILAIVGSFSGIYVISKACTNIKGNFYVIASHAAFSLGVVSISVCSLLSHDDQFLMKIGDTKSFLNFEMNLEDIKHQYISNYLTKTAVIKVFNQKNNAEIFMPELRIFPIEKQMTSEPSISRNILYDLHINMNQVTDDGFLFSFYYRPMMNFLWASIFIMFLLLLSRTVQSLDILIKYLDLKV